MVEGVQTSARKFIELYDSLANDATWKNEPIDHDVIVQAYLDLATDADKYTALRYLESKNDTDLLNDILCVNPNNLGSKSRLFESIADLKAKVASMLKNGSDKWAIRREIEEGLYVIKLETAAVEKDIVDDPCLVGTTYLHTLRNSIQQQLLGLYTLCTPEGSDRNMFFDSDGDYIDHFMAGAAEYAFDDKDCDPLVANNADSDGDLAPDDIDTAANDPTQWNDLEIDEIVAGNNYDVSRDQNGYVIKIRIALVPTDDLSSDVKEDLNNPEYMANMEAEIEKWFLENSDMPGVRLDVEFVTKENAHAVLDVNNKTDIRTNSASWAKNTLDRYDVLNHEILHLLTLPDNYNEFLVHAKRRDHTFEPGYLLADQQNVMNGPPPNATIHEAQLKFIIASAVQRKKNLSESVAIRGIAVSTEKVESQETPVLTEEQQDKLRLDRIKHQNMTYLIFNNNSAKVKKAFNNWTANGDSALPPKPELDELLSALKEFCQKRSNHDLALIDIARLKFMLGEKEEAMKILHEILNKNDAPPCVLIDACEVLHSMGFKDEAKSKLEELSATSADAMNSLASLYKKEGNSDIYFKKIKLAVEQDQIYFEQYASELVARSDFQGLLNFLDTLKCEEGSFIASDILVWKFIAYREMGNKEMMSDTLKKLTFGNEKNIGDKLALMADLLDEAQRPDLAEKYRDFAKTAFEKTQTASELADNLAYLQSAKGVISEGNLRIQTLCKALAEDPTNNDLRLKLINAYIAEYKVCGENALLRSASLQVVELLRIRNYMKYNRHLESTPFTELLDGINLNAETKEALIGAMKKLEPVYSQKSPADYGLYYNAYKALLEKTYQ